MRDSTRRILPGALALSLLLLATTAHGDAATAEALFREGRKLLKDGQTSAACEKFAASQRMDASSGTLINLADCHTKEGKSASAWAEFLAASRMAKNQGDTARAEEAAKRARDLEPSLSYVSVKVSAPLAGLQVKRDDVVVEEAALSAQIPIDAGAHTISATAPGYKPWSKSISVGTAKDKIEVVIPALEKDSSVPPPASATTAPTVAPTSVPPPPPTEGRSPTLGYVIGGAGVVFVGVGAFFGLKALSTYKDAENDCGGAHTNCPASSSDKKSTAGTQANIANVGIGLGVVGIGVGTYLLLTSKSSSSTKETAGVSVVPVLGASSQGAAVTGRF